MFQFNNTTFSLRPAVIEDVAQILEIEKPSYPVPWTAAAFEAELKKDFSRFLVLTDDETDQKIIAYIVYWRTEGDLYLLNLTSHPNWRGLGVASQLLQHLVHEGLRENVVRLFLEVRKSNLGAIALYQKQGFVIDHIKKSFYEDGEDACFMQLFLHRKDPALTTH